MMASLSMTPAPVPTISAWSKPINFAHATSNGGQQPSVPASQQAAVVVPADMKLDKGGDQHDSGIDVSDQPNSPSSSTRSSPSGDSGNKLIISTNIPHSPSADPSTTASLKVLGLHILARFCLPCLFSSLHHPFSFFPAWLFIFSSWSCIIHIHLIFF